MGWARNLRANPQVAVHIGSGDEPVIVEGTVMFTEEQGDEVEEVKPSSGFPGLSSGCFSCGSEHRSQVDAPPWGR
ncbi:MAG: hypothetical protein LC808_20785 [Actinobacteria bacterium]|nr:hypothetical protein [Actinomycetota bacterium]